MKYGLGISLGFLSFFVLEMYVLAKLLLQFNEKP
jgi:hypothetical protein